MKFESKKIENFCNDLIEFYDNDKNFNNKLKSITKKIDSLNLDLNNNELSKSKKLVDQIKTLYFK